LLLDSFLPAHPIFWDDALGLCLSTFLAFHVPGISQASRLALPAPQTCCLLLILTLVGRIGASWGLDFHLDDAVSLEEFPHIATGLA
jgi:hypothetical protein